MIDIVPRSHEEGLELSEIAAAYGGVEWILRDTSAQPRLSQ